MKKIFLMAIVLGMGLSACGTLSQKQIDDARARRAEMVMMRGER